jgi:hypothetical protein
MDPDFASAVASKTLMLNAASGQVTEVRPSRFKFWS